ncbi:hypothetical protein PHISP_01831 [Aspergillus sp. HF37]|nr:hypothetical protein PHISP_01831 [Aspergillus sp. HF37]
MRFPHLRKKKKQESDDDQVWDEKPPKQTAPIPSVPQKPSPVPEGPGATQPENAQSPLPLQPEGQPTSPAKNPFSATGDAEVDEDIREIWADVQKRVAKLAGQEGKPVIPMGIDDVVANLTAAQNPDAPPSRKEKVKMAFSQSLTAIQRVGEVVAYAASNVFAPAADCFNAVNFVINAYQGYQAAFESLADLFKQCTDYLNRLPYQIEGKMDAKLTKIAAQHLDLFIGTCEVAIDMQDSVKQRIKMAFQVAFTGEDRIQPLMADMNILLQREDRMISSQTFMRTGKIEDFTKRTEQNVAQMRSESKDNHRQESIKRGLGFQGEPTADWRKRYSEYLSQRLRGTGTWIFDERTFSNWESGQSAANVLVIEGGSGSGKSILASAIIQHFMHGGRMKDAEVFVAYYFLDGRSLEAAKSATNLEIVAKSLVWQFTRSNRPYMKSAAKICGRTQEVGPAFISHDLLFGNSEVNDMDAVFYIVIDGLGGRVGEGMLKFLQRSSSAITGRRIRVLVTVDPRCSQQLATAGGVSFDTISISDNNRSDVETLINWRMDSMPALSNKRRGTISQLRKHVCNGLSDACKGDYFKINLALDDISKREYPSQIMDALKNAREDRPVQVKKEIEELNQKCSKAEISEINEIVLWIRCCRAPLKEKEMTAALCAKGGESSLLRLRDKFREKYSLFRVTSKGEVAFRAPEVEESIPTKHDFGKAEQRRDAAAVSLGEMAMVNHFLRTVCPPETFAKLDLDRFLEQKNEVRGNPIYKDSPHTEETKMVRTCLRVLTGEVDHPCEELLPYARSHFADHLWAVDLDLVDIELKSTVGPLLVKLFTDDASIDRLQQVDELTGSSSYQRQVARELLLDDNTAKVMLEWLGDSAVTSGIDSEGTRMWISGLVHEESYRRLLTPVATRMAVHLTQKPHFIPLTRDSFLFVASFLQKFGNGGEKEETGSVKQIESIERWCWQVLGVRKKNSLWHTQIGSVLQLYEQQKPAEDRARLALDISREDWRASTLLASLVKPSEGIQILEPAARRLESSGTWEQNSLHRMGLAKMLFILAELHCEEGNLDAATGLWKRAMEVDFTDYGRVVRCLEHYDAGERWSDIIEALQTIDKNSTEQQDGLAELIIWSSCGIPSVHSILLRAALRTKQLRPVVVAYERSVKLLEERGEHTTLANARYHYGRVIKAHQARSSPAIEQWFQALEDADPYLLSTLISNIAPYYMQKAENNTHDSEAVDYYIEKVETLLPESIKESEVILPPRMYLARYFVRLGNVRKAKTITRDIVKVSLDILTDGDEDNDLDAYNKLLWVFIPLDDRENIKAIRTLMSRRFGRHQGTVCDGDCNRSWELWDESWWCQDCINVNFENECQQKVQQGGLPFVVCNGSHCFLKAPKMDLDNTPEDSVPFGDGWVPVEDWLARIEKEYVHF